MNQWLLTLLVIGATYRLTRLLTRDQLPIVAWPRERLLLFWFPQFADADSRLRATGRGRTLKPHWGGLGHGLAYLITCDWCVSVYVAAGVVGGIWAWTPWYTTWVEPVLVGLTASAATGLIAQREPD